MLIYAIFDDAMLSLDYAAISPCHALPYAADDDYAAFRR